VKKIDKNLIYGHSPEIIARQIEETIVIVPLISGIGKLDEDLFSLNDTGKLIWEMLDGKSNVRDVIQKISTNYEENVIIIENDVIELLQMLLDKELIIEIRDSV
jgi:hypothetical protein